MECASSDGHVGLVVKVEGDKAHIRFMRSSACAHCGACLTAGDNEMEITLKNTLGAKEGDQVSVDLSPKRIVQASLLAYAVPLALLLAGVFLGSRVNDWFGLVLGVAACALSYFILRMVEKRSAKKNSFAPRMERILGEDEPAQEQDD